MVFSLFNRIFGLGLPSVKDADANSRPGSDQAKFGQALAGVSEPDRISFIAAASKLIDGLKDDEQAKIIKALERISEPERKKRVADSASKLFSANMNGEKRAKIIQDLAKINMPCCTAIQQEKQNWNDFNIAALRLIGFNIDDRANIIIEALARVCVSDWKGFADAASKLLTGKMNGRARAKIIKALARVSASDLENVAAAASRLIGVNVNNEKLPGITRASANASASDPKNVDVAVSRLIARNMNDEERAEIIIALASVHASDWKDFADSASKLIGVKMNGEERAIIIETLAGVLTADLKSFAESSLRLIADSMNGQERARIIAALSAVSTLDLESVVEASSRLIADSMNGQERARIIAALSAVSTLDLKSVAETASRLIGHNMNDEERIVIIKAAAEIFAPDRESVGAASLRLIAHNMNGQERAVIIKALSEVFARERERFIAIVNRLTNGMSTFSRARVIQALAGISAADRESIVREAARCIANNINGENLARIIEARASDFASAGIILNVNLAEINTAPARVLIALAKHIDKKKQFPIINYLGSIGVDEGGLTRDFITRLFKAMTNPSKLMPPLTSEGEGISFRLNDKSDADDQIKHCEALGVIFAYAAKQHQNIVTGRYFHPDVFNTLYTFPRGHINGLPALEKVEEIQEFPSFKELLKIYLKTCCGNYFGPRGAKHEEIDSAVGRFVDENKLNDYLKMLETENKDRFLKESVYPFFFPLLAIAKSMHKYLKSENWDKIKRKSKVEFADLIQGKMSKDVIIDALQRAGDSANGSIQLLSYLKQWITETSVKQLSDFLWAVTGSSSITVQQKLNINVRERGNPYSPFIFHTCSCSMDVRDIFKDYETFKAALEDSIEACVRGFTIL